MHFRKKKYIYIETTKATITITQESKMLKKYKPKKNQPQYEETVKMICQASLILLATALIQNMTCDFNTAGTKCDKCECVLNGFSQNLTYDKLCF